MTDAGAAVSVVPVLEAHSNLVGQEVRVPNGPEAAQVELLVVGQVVAPQTGQVEQPEPVLVGARAVDNRSQPARARHVPAAPPAHLSHADHSSTVCSVQLVRLSRPGMCTLLMAFACRRCSPVPDLAPAEHVSG